MQGWKVAAMSNHCPASEGKLAGEPGPFFSSLIVVFLCQECITMERLQIMPCLVLLKLPEILKFL